MLRIGEKFSLAGCEVDVDELQALVPTGKAKVAIVNPPTNGALRRRA
jgi:hypothetical protein